MIQKECFELASDIVSFGEIAVLATAFSVWVVFALLVVVLLWSPFPEFLRTAAPSPGTAERLGRHHGRADRPTVTPLVAAREAQWLWAVGALFFTMLALTVVMWSFSARMPATVTSFNATRARLSYDKGCVLSNTSVHAFGGHDACHVHFDTHVSGVYVSLALVPTSIRTVQDAGVDIVLPLVCDDRNAVVSLFPDHSIVEMQTSGAEKTLELFVAKRLPEGTDHRYSPINVAIFSARVLDDTDETLVVFVNGRHMDTRRFPLCGGETTPFAGIVQFHVHEDVSHSFAINRVNALGVQTEWKRSPHLRAALWIGTTATMFAIVMAVVSAAPKAEEWFWSPAPATAALPKRD